MNAIKFALLAAAALTVGAATKSVAQADDNSTPVVTSPHDCHYDVYYRNCEHESWRFHGSYDCIHEARRAADRLSDRGYDTKIRHHG